MRVIKKTLAYLAFTLNLLAAIIFGWMSFELIEDGVLASGGLLGVACVLCMFAAGAWYDKGYFA